MELKLEKFVKALEVTTNIHTQNLSPVIVRITDKDSGVTTVFCCGYQKPRYVVLPVQAIWIDFDPASDGYQVAHRRLSKGATPDTDVWAPIYFYADAFPEQTYSPDDLALISVALPSPATDVAVGIGLLSVESPAVVLADDTRLTDARDPLPHMELHPETPATMCGQQQQPIADSVPVVRAALVSDGTQYNWRRLREQDLEAV